MAKLIAGELGIRIEPEAEIRENLNTAGTLNNFFDPLSNNRELTYTEIYNLMLEAMEKTNSDIAFFVIGLNDWRGWSPSSEYWINKQKLNKIKKVPDNSLFIIVLSPYFKHYVLPVFLKHF